jgi:hypothetical protein
VERHGREDSGCHPARRKRIPATVAPGETPQHTFLPGHPARRVRLKVDQACQATAMFKYE